MTPKELSTEFYGMAHDAAMNVMDIIQQESTCRCDMEHSYNKKGIRIDFMFRGEVDYSLVVPWEYVQDDIKIRDYYNRFFSKQAQDADTITEIAVIADNFIEQELKKLKG